MISIPKGTKDVLPNEAYKWHYIENKARHIADLYALREVRTPVFEHTELFLRGVGETTDIVNKEMYTFEDKGGRSLTLKPEGTAGVARSFVENSLYSLPQPVKMFYLTPVFRYERPQSGRLREHHQFGVEVFGSDLPETDVEIISIAKSMFNRLGITKLQQYINSIGCPECRKVYNSALKDYLRGQLPNMCRTCNDRFEKNPLRILDCKEEECIKINADAPKVTDYLCDDCKAHMAKVEQYLTALGIDYIVNPRIVRGLDYYTRTVFEFVSTDIGAQGTICGGGRYNGLVEEVGGKPTPAVGFGMGLERLINVLESLNLSTGEKEAVTVYVAPIGEIAKVKAMQIIAELRKNGISADTDFMNRSVKAQMKFADKINAKYVVVIGEMS
jgi:histidyl-tRNA synthetase